MPQSELSTKCKYCLVAEKIHIMKDTIYDRVEKIFQIAKYGLSEDKKLAREL